MSDEDYQRNWLTPAARQLLREYTPHLLDELCDDIQAATFERGHGDLVVCHTDEDCERLRAGDPGLLHEHLPWRPCLECGAFPTPDVLFANLSDILASVRAAEALTRVPTLLTGTLNDLDEAGAILGHATCLTRIASWVADLAPDVYERVYNDLLLLRADFRTAWAGRQFPQVGQNTTDDVYVWLEVPLHQLYLEDASAVRRAVALAYGLDLRAGVPLHRWGDYAQNASGRPGVVSVGTLLRLPREVRQSSQMWLRTAVNGGYLTDLGPAVARGGEPAVLDLFNQWMGDQALRSVHPSVQDVMAAARAAVQPVPVS